MSTITTAVILAAGLGSRLKDRTKERPKGFLEIDGQSMIERSIQALISRGINRIIIGTGYLHEHFDALKTKFPQIVTHRNEWFATTGSMHTLYSLQHIIDQPFLLLESDLLYEGAALDHLLSDATPDIILASGATHSGDEVYIQHSREGYLQNMSKDRTSLDHVEGELVGISKISLPTYKKMTLFAEQKAAAGNRTIHYEDALVGVAANQNISVKVIEDLAWCEIDDESHLQRALEWVYPKIRIQNPESQNPEPRIQNPESRTQNPASSIQHPES
jgi:2-aminoethylphosphonate-pyruvate transaminase